MAPLTQVGNGSVYTVGNTAPAGPARSETSVGAFVQNRANQVLGQQQRPATVTPNMETANAAPAREAVAPPVATDKTEIARQQTDFTAKMKAAGIEASNPPSEAQLKQYFGTFNSADKRGQALEQFENYTNAFHTHTAEVKGHESDDVKYSPEKTYYYKGATYDSEKEAKAAQKADPGGVLGRVSSADASKWSDVDGKKSYNGRKIQDCEGFAFMSQDLLGAAGYQVTHTNNADANGAAHSMTVVKDPSSGKIAVTSNTKTFQGGTQEELLKKGWAHAGGTLDPGTFYTGDTQAHAQTMQQAGVNNW